MSEIGDQKSAAFAKASARQGTRKGETRRKQTLNVQRPTLNAEVAEVELKACLYPQLAKLSLHVGDLCIVASFAPQSRDFHLREDYDVTRRRAKSCLR